MKRIWCDRCEQEIIKKSPYNMDLPATHGTHFHINDNYEICRSCLEVVRKVLNNECSIIVGEKK